jgi:hypothetical protein
MVQILPRAELAKDLLENHRNSVIGERTKALGPLFEELADKSAREIARIVNDRNVAIPTGKPWSAMTVIHALDRLVAHAA